MTFKRCASGCLLVVASCSRFHSGSADEGPSAASPCTRPVIVRRASEYVLSDSAGIIRGTVFDAATGRPMRGARAQVVILDEARTQELDSLGQCRIALNPADRPTVRLRFRAIGFVVENDTVTMVSAHGLTMHRYLTYEPVCLSPVTTGESRPHVP